ncbi:M23 family metallopeptidase [Streptomyces sp. NPDC052051]|uniref:M23 family metallopeptidase n=1 Tax=Streptomyces sp. NPDC052051 TaxID=3154649 RepID=UPI00341875CD
MNDRHPSGSSIPPAQASDAASAHYVPYGHQGGQYGEFDTSYATPAATAYGGFPGDGSTGAYDTAQWSTGGHPTFGAGGYETFGTGTHQVPAQDPYAAQHHAAYDTGAYDTTAWAVGYQELATAPAQATAPDATGQWDAHAWLEAGQSADRTQQWDWGTGTFDTGTYDATQWNSGGVAEHEAQTQPHEQSATSAASATATFEQVVPEPFEQQATATFESAVPFDQQATATFEQATATATFEQAVPFDQQATAHFEHLAYEEPEAGEEPEHLATEADAEADDDPSLPATPCPRGASRAASRSRRRPAAKRSGLLTIAVPSVCVMGVAGIAAAATVGLGGGDGKETTAKAPTTPSVKPSTANKKLDTQLASLSAGADDFRDRASRTQQRIDLKAQQVAEQKKAIAEAALKERLRPKFAVPVLQHGLSAYFGQAGVNWMSVHTGIDFPVSYGTTVMAATDGTARTQWNSAYGNMMIVTAKDGTETWYCHLSTYRVSSGTSVKAGQPIAYSGNSGNSTGPHLHFEVRPGGGAAIDPLSWLRSHDLNPS